MLESKVLAGHIPSDYPLGLRHLHKDVLPENWLRLAL